MFFHNVNRGFLMKIIWKPRLTLLKFMTSRMLQNYYGSTTLTTIFRFRCSRLQNLKCRLYSVAASQSALPKESFTPDQSFKAEDVEIIRTKTPGQVQGDVRNIKFGHAFSDHMLEVDWSAKSGWSRPLISPVHDFSLHPGSKVLHYAVELFEGTKAYRGVDNKIRLFRPMENMKRMNSTCERSCLPTFDGAELVKLIKTLVSVDSAWVPKATEDQPSSLYIRPTVIGIEPALGVSRSLNAKLFVLTGPVGPYYPTGMAPVKLLADPKYVRAWPGGTGNYKMGRLENRDVISIAQRKAVVTAYMFIGSYNCFALSHLYVRAWPGGTGNYKMGSNYASTMAIQSEAVAKGCQQVLWLFGDDHQLTEVGAMNLFTYWINEQGEKELITAPLNGLVLPGITRKSLIELGHKWGEFKVTERDYTMKEILKALNENRLMEMFGAGTACLVSPIEGILYQGEMVAIPTMKNPTITNWCMKELLDIQYGRTPSDWVEVVE